MYILYILPYHIFFYVAFTVSTWWTLSPPASSAPPDLGSRLVVQILETRNELKIFANLHEKHHVLSHSSLPTKWRPILLNFRSLWSLGGHVLHIGNDEWTLPQSVWFFLPLGNWVPTSSLHQGLIGIKRNNLGDGKQSTSKNTFNDNL